MRTLPLLILAAACGPQPMVVPDAKDPVVARLEGGLEAGTAVAQAPVAMTGTPMALASAGGTLVVVTADGLRVGAAPLPVGAPDEETSTGAVRFVAHRGNTSLWVVAGSGLFHLADGRLLKSPLSADLAGQTVTAIDGYGEGAAEELWLTTSAGVQQVKGGMLRPVEVQFPKLGALGVPVAAIGAGPGQAVVVAQQQVFLADLNAGTAAWIAKDVGTLNAFARSDDGTVYLATSTGLYERLKSGEVRVRPGVVAADVASAFGSVLVAAGGKVARLEGGAWKTFGDLPQPRARGLQVDAAGDTFALDGAALTKLSTGKPVSFAADVKPFLVQHCATCHAAGSAGAPVIDFTDVAAVQAVAPRMIQRLRAEGVSPMPPAGSEVLSAAQYAVVLTWSAGGMQP